MPFVTASLVDEMSEAEITEAFRPSAGHGDVGPRCPVCRGLNTSTCITVGEVNFGVSPGDSYLGVSYGYVGSFKPAQLTGAF